VLLLLRIVGTFNAAIWFGSAVFFTFALTTGIFSEETKRVFGDYYTGVIAQTLVGRYFIVHLVCGVIALLHFFGEMSYAGRPFRRFTFGLLIVVLSLGLLGGFVFMPKLKELHQVKYRGAPEQQERAKQQFTRLHVTSRIGDIISLIAILIYTWQVTNPPDHTRFVSAQKFRG
jgi:hypothetical protein